MLKIMIVDDHPVVRSGLAAMFAAEDDMEVAVTAQGGTEALKWLSENGWDGVDVIVSDVHMPHGDGFDLLAAVCNSTSKTKMLMLAGMPLKDEESRARTDGAAGYLPKSLDGRRLINAVRQVGEPDAHFVSENFEQDTGILTDKELTILQYASEGKTRDEIAIILGVGAETVKTHLRTIMRKFNTSNTTASVSRAYELGLLRA